MAKEKKPTAAPRSADRLENLKRTQTRAGKTKSSMATRVMQNRGVKDGTIRLGKSGKSYNVYDAKTGTWKRGVVKAATPSKPKPTPAKPAPKMNSSNTKFATDRLTNSPPTKKGYLIQGAEGNKRLQPNPKAKKKPTTSGGRGVIRWGANTPNNPNYRAR